MEPAPLAEHVVASADGRSERPPLRVVLATRSPGLLQALTARWPDLAVDAYPLDPHLVLQAHGSPEALDAAHAALRTVDTTLRAVPSDGRTTFVLAGGTRDEATIRRLARRAAHVVPPIRWERGEARVTLLVGGDADLRDLQALFPDARLLAKRTVAHGSVVGDALTSPLFLPDLTRKQARALVTAFEAGYYDFPRRATAEAVSVGLGVSRSTFQEHLHRAERQVLHALLPLVRARAAEAEGAAAEEEALALYGRFSRELGLYVQLEILGGRVRRVRLTPEPPAEAAPSHPYLARVLDHLRTGREDLGDIPVDLEVGPFEREVLDFLRTLPPGSTATYGEIARALGRPRAARAVGNACARNPVPVIIPCHRVVPATGGVGAYSGGKGPATKRRLLEREGALDPTAE